VSELKREKENVYVLERVIQKGNRIDVVLHSGFPVLLLLAVTLSPFSHPFGREMRAEWMRRMS
jgi:hypothetical protein